MCGSNAAATYWLSPVGKRGKRVFFPEGYKDACEAAMAGVELRGWAEEVVGRDEIAASWYNLMAEVGR